MLPPVCEDGVRLTELIVHQVHDIVDVLFPAVLRSGTFTYSRLAAIYRFLRSGKFLSSGHRCASSSPGDR